MKVKHQCVLIASVLFVSACSHEPMFGDRCIDAERDVGLVSITSEQMLLAAQSSIADQRLYAFFKDQRPILETAISAPEDCLASLSNLRGSNECLRSRAVLMKLNVRHLLNAIDMLEVSISEEEPDPRRFAVEILTTAATSSDELGALPCRFSCQAE